MPHAASEFAVMGVDFGGTKTDIALADSHGTILLRERLDTRTDLGPDHILGRTAETVRRLEQAAREGHGLPVTGWAAVCPGIIRADGIQLTPNLPGWETLALSARLASEFGVPEVRVGNDVRAAALAELRFGALRGIDTGIYVSLGTGIAAALIVGGQVIAGAHQAAGEIGYMNPGGAPVGAVAAGHAPLEELVAGRGLGQRASALLGEPVTSAELFRRNDPRAQEFVRHSLETLAMALANLAVFVDPARIVIGGGMMAAADVILPALTEMVTSATAFPPEFRAAHFLEDASLHGAVALALNTETTTPPN
ncbi:ROK family protein [Nocardia sp. SYP-A9097]|uniref:ROK family protein n=1 Tax=Nocardia sp. SYP-A9097 TaxID=2663237 RepID=UPI00129B045F|nr:ROK family protein [Nocardia sp. SYP-A9097]MRH88204.1 ROK family protein [Nocardia sp. SYP-A9097]